MGKLVVLMHVSLDGYMAGPNGEIDWVTFDAELERTVTDLRQNVDATVYGGVTYKIMEQHWPNVLKNPNSPQSQLDFAKWVDKKLKVVVSTTRTSVEWNNTKLINSNVEAELKKLKQSLPGDLLLIGSARLTHSLLATDLIDELRINVNPIALGSGIPLFGVKNKMKLKLLSEKKLNSGVLALHYAR